MSFNRQEAKQEEPRNEKACECGISTELYQYVEDVLVLGPIIVFKSEIEGESSANLIVQAQYQTILTGYSTQPAVNVFYIVTICTGTTHHVQSLLMSKHVKRV